MLPIGRQTPDIIYNREGSGKEVVQEDIGKVVIYNNQDKEIL